MNFISHINNQKNTITRALGILLGVGLLVVGGMYFTKQAYAEPYDVLTETTIPTTDTDGTIPALTTDDQGNVWFIQPEANILGKIDSSDALTEYDLPSVGSAISDIAYTPDGFLWVSLDDGSGLLKIDPTDGSIVLNVQGSASGQSLAVNLYTGELIAFSSVFTDLYNIIDTSTAEATETVNIGNLDIGISDGLSFIGDRWWGAGHDLGTGDTIMASFDPVTRLAHKYPLSESPASRPIQGSDGNIWYVDTDHVIHKFDIVTGSVTALTDPDIASRNLARLALGLDGSLWTVQTNGFGSDELLKVDPRTGEATAFVTEARYDSYNNDIVTGPQNSLWISSYLPTAAIGKWQLDTSPTPDAVRNLTFRREVGSLTVHWQSPYSANDGYVVSYKKVSDIGWTSLPATDATEVSITDDIDNTSAYEVSVTAQDALGTLGVESTVRAEARTTPHPLSNLRAASTGNGFVSVQWDMPDNTDTGWPLTTLHLEHKLSSSSTWTSEDVNPNNSNAFVFDLTNGLSYDFRMSAENPAGTSTYSNTLSATPATTPGSPTDVMATGGNTQAILAWTPPTNDGGSAITDYTVQYKLSSASTWTTFNDGVSTLSSTIVTGLTNGSSYDFRVATVNAKGSSTFSSQLASATPSTTPGAPESLSATAGDGQVVLSWNAPASNGGRTITDYLIEYKQHAASTWDTYDDGVSVTSEATITGLTNGTSYDFRISATSIAGTGDSATILGTSPVAPPVEDDGDDEDDPSTPPPSEEDDTPPSKPSHGGKKSSTGNTNTHSGSSTETDTPTESDSSVFTIDVTDDTAFTSATPTFTGTYSPDTTLFIEIHSNPITAEITTDGNGDWAYTPTEPLDNGDHTISVYRAKENGKRGTLLSTTAFSIQETPTTNPPANDAVLQTETQSDPSSTLYWFIGGGILAALVVIIIIAVRLRRRVTENNFL